MNIYHIIPKLAITANGTVIGGAASALHNLAVQQSKDNDVTILSYFPVDQNNQKPTCRNIEYRKLPMLARQNSSEYGVEFILKTFWEGLVSRKCQDIIHGHSGHLDYILSTVGFNLARKLPTVYTLYCPIVLKSHVTGFSGRQNLLSSALKHIDRFIAISSNITRTMVSFGIPEKKIHTIVPGINIEKFHPSEADPEVKQKLKVHSSSPVFLFVGSAAPTKNLETLIKAMAFVVRKLPDAVLIITTELRLKHFEARTRMLEKLIEDLNLQNHIIQLGIIDNMQEVMAASDILVAPFLSTDGPSDYFLAALEAMSVGRPVIVSPVGGMPEIVDESVGILVSPGESEQIAHSMVELANATESRKAMGKEASRRIAEKFHPALGASQIYRVYQEIL